VSFCDQCLLLIIFIPGTSALIVQQTPLYLQPEAAKAEGNYNNPGMGVLTQRVGLLRVTQLCHHEAAVLPHLVNSPPSRVLFSPLSFSPLWESSAVCIGPQTNH
jgi:hypothetical protein